MMRPRPTSLYDLSIEETTHAFRHSTDGTIGRRKAELAARPIIAWDGEGMRLSGPSRPQHYVVFGCSADIDGVLVGKDLSYRQLCRYITDIGAAFPTAVHIGYGFRYDSNMIIRHMPTHNLLELRENNETYFKDGPDRYRVAWLPGKRLTITRDIGRTGKRKVTVSIDDIVSFFAAPFIDATESILADELTDEDREVIAHGKAQRGETTWEDLDEVLKYWRAEIRLMQRLGEKFREVMYSAGFMLTAWYGPGALSSYLIRNRGLRDHIVTGPTDGLPSAVHTASKHAYAGGRFELFRFGRFGGDSANPINGIDINSAYPAAMSQAPSLGIDHGFWEWEEYPTEIAYFGVYRIRFRGEGTNPFEHRAMPLFHRDDKGTISYPQNLEGWYWSPEAAAVFGAPGVDIVEGWVWVNDGSRPFKFLEEMYYERLAIGKKNTMSMPYKLGPNSMYGKFAQRVGHRNGEPPRSHCLPLAGWVTSFCRSQLFGVIRQIPAEHLIAVETDGLFTTADISGLGLQLSDRLGEWDHSVYDEMLYVQSGVYHRRSGREWLGAKSRGLDSASVSLPRVRDYLKASGPGEFGPLTVNMRDRFVGLTAAAASTAPLKVRHCRWEGGSRELIPGGTGKRAHVPGACTACQNGHNAWDEPHTLIIRSRSNGGMSAPHYLPWETGSEYEDTAKIRELDAIESDMI